MKECGKLPEFDKIDDVFARYHSAVDRLLDLEASFDLHGRPELRFVKRLYDAWTELKKPAHRRNARTIWRALERFEREVALFETELDSFEARLRLKTGAC